MKKNSAHLDGQYTVFGQVVEGINLLFEIEEDDIMTSVQEI